jgi:hypothetical protein
VLLNHRLTNFALHAHVIDDIVFGIPKRRYEELIPKGGAIGLSQLNCQIDM